MTTFHIGLILWVLGAIFFKIIGIKIDKLLTKANKVDPKKG